MGAKLAVWLAVIFHANALAAVQFLVLAATRLDYRPVNHDVVVVAGFAIGNGKAECVLKKFNRRVDGC